MCSWKKQVEIETKWNLEYNTIYCAFVLRIVEIETKWNLEHLIWRDYDKD